MNIEEYKEIAYAQYNALDTHYQNGFFFGDKAKKIEHVKSWITQIIKEKMPSEDLKNFTVFLIKESNTFKNKAPNITQYIDAYNEWKKDKKSPDNENTETDFDTQFELMYRSFSIRYERLWAANQVGNMDSHKSFWKQELIAFDIPSSILMKAYSKLRTMQEYKQYPPNIDQFIDVAKVISFSGNLPTAEEAYIQAITFRESDKLHPLVKHVRSKFGYATLVNMANKNMKLRFDCEYRNNLEMVLSGQLELNEFNSDAEVNPVASPSASKVCVVSAIDEILTGLK